MEANVSTSKCPSGQDPHLQLLEHFEDIFKCTICLSKLEDPHMCPQCSKLYCYVCISEWLLSKSEQHLYCPNCKADLQVDRLAKVRWLEDVQKLKRNCLEPTATTAISTTDGTPDSNGNIGKKKDICPKHPKDINFYCCTCELGICDECAIADDHHLEHTFKRLDVIYNINVKNAEEEFEQVRHYTKKIESLVEKVEHNAEQVKNAKEEKLAKIRSTAESATEWVESQANDMLQKLEDHKVALLTEIQDIEQSLRLIEEEVKASTQLQLIAKKSRIIKDCNKIRMNPIKDFEQLQVPVIFKNEIPSIYETGIFVIKNFPKLDDNMRVYSKLFTDNFGHIWHINATGYGEQLGIFLGLVKGPPCRTECRFELLHPNSNRNIKYTFTHQFDLSNVRSLGYFNFVTRKTIMDDNYLKDDDSLELLYLIGPCDQK